MSIAKELDDLLAERARLKSRLKQALPARDYSLIIACSAMAAWWMIIGICVAWYFESVVGIGMILLTVPATIVFAIGAIVWKIWSPDHGRNEVNVDPFDPRSLAVKARLDEIDERLAVLRTMTSE